MKSVKGREQRGAAPPGARPGGCAQWRPHGGGAERPAGPPVASGVGVLPGDASHSGGHAEAERSGAASRAGSGGFGWRTCCTAGPVVVEDVLLGRCRPPAWHGLSVVMVVGVGPAPAALGRPPSHFGVARRLFDEMPPPQLQ